MFGYQTRDYRPVQWASASVRAAGSVLRSTAAGELPTQENEEDPVYRKYQEFRKFTTQDLLEKIYRKVKELNPETAVCTYSSRHVDLVRSESNSAVDRPRPLWAMESESNVSFVQETFNNRFSKQLRGSMPWIFFTASWESHRIWNELSALRGHGGRGNLDWCIIGVLKPIPDKMNFEGNQKGIPFP